MGANRICLYADDATVIEYAAIGAGITIGTVLVRDVPGSATVAGCPAKPIQ